MEQRPRYLYNWWCWIRRRAAMRYPRLWVASQLLREGIKHLPETLALGIIGLLPFVGMWMILHALWP